MYKTIFIILSLFIISCSKDNNSKKQQSKQKPQTLFSSLSFKETGIRFRNDLKEDLNTTNTIYYFEYFYHGSGVSIGDINNDGLPDIFFSSNNSSNKLYLNEGNMKFKDISLKAGINKGKHWSTGTTMADVNNDGYMDIYVCQGGSDIRDKSKRQNLLFINNKDNTFTESAKEFGLNDPNLSTHSSFFDYDKDGDLDCIVINETEKFRLKEDYIQNEIIPFPNELLKNSTRLFENVDGHFVDRTIESGLLKFSYNLGVITADYNDDGWPDIYISNDYEISDYLFINQKDGTFKEEIKSRTKHTSWFSMGLDYNDFNNDGLSDITVVDMSPNDHIRSKIMMRPMSSKLFWHNIKTLKRQYGYMFNSLQLNNGNGTFSNISHMAGTSKSEWSWANLLADFDNDTYKDNYIATGIRKDFTNNDSQQKLKALRVKSPKDDPKIKTFHQSLPGNRLENEMYQNQGNLKFKDVSNEWGLTDKTFSNGAAYADLDRDGDLDIVVNNIDDFASILQNNSETLKKNNYLQFQFPKNAKGYNGKIKLYLKNGETLFQEYIPSRGYCSSVDHLLHFGLGKNETIPKAEIIWPNGAVEIMKNVKPNQIIELEISKAIHSTQKKTEKAFITEINPNDLGLNYKHAENDFNDFDLQTLLPYKHSTTGPSMAKADFNGDGLEDIFIGSAFNQNSILYFQTKESKFIKSQQNSFDQTKLSETTKAIALDFDKDGDMDILSINGSYEFEINAGNLKDILYINNGKGIFKEASETVFNPPNLNGSVACIADVNNDGYPDVFVGGRVVPGNYPKPESSYFMINNKGTFKINTSLYPLQNIGIVRDATFADLDNDNSMELIIASEWESIKIINNSEQKNKPTNLIFRDNKKFGWWSAVLPFDFDNDGDLDLLVGNVGQNTKFESQKKVKLGIRANDFDKNGTLDIVLSKEYKGEEVPVRGLQCSSEQMPFIKKKFKSYEGFAKANLDEILGTEGIKTGISKTLTETRSGIFINKNGVYHFTPFENIGQISPISKFITHDVDQDGRDDILFAGNLFDTEVETPRLDAGNGLVLLNTSPKDSMKLKALTIMKSGLNIPGDFRDMKKVKLANGNTILVALNNNEGLQAFQLPL